MVQKPVPHKVLLFLLEICLKEMKDNIYNNVKWKRNVGYLQQCEVEKKCGKYTQHMYGIRSVGTARKL